MSSRQHLFSNWEEIARGIRTAHCRALLVDFDGTLVRIAHDPRRVRLPDRTRRLLEEISRRGTIVGIVSGRALEDVRKRVGLRGIWYAGSHGYFLHDRDNHTHSLLNPTLRRQMATLDRSLIPRFRKISGIFTEFKGASLAVHYRNCPARSRAQAWRIVKDVLRQKPKLRLLKGKQIWELIPDTPVDKGAAVEEILRREFRRCGKSRAMAFYLGDDATDERVFSRMAESSVAVGKHSRTAAHYYLRGPAEVRQLLERWKAAVA